MSIYSTSTSNLLGPLLCSIVLGRAEEPFIITRVTT